jgi:hypothetical protein
LKEAAMAIDKFLTSVCNLAEAVNSFLHDSSGDDLAHIEAMDQHVEDVLEEIRAAPELVHLHAWLDRERARVSSVRGSTA